MSKTGKKTGDPVKNPKKLPAAFPDKFKTGKQKQSSPDKKAG